MIRNKQTWNTMDIKSAMDFERKQELERRKKTRLLQVRQQAKDFSRKMRESILAVSTNQQNCVLENNKKKLMEDKKEHLLQLEEMFNKCLKNVGEGHKNALVQPNINQLIKLDAIRQASGASKRGENARKKHFEHEAIYRQRRSAPIMRKKKNRSTENLRSYYISSLPKPKSNHIVLPSNNPKLRNKTDVIKEIPSHFPTAGSVYNSTLPNNCYDKKLQDWDKDYITTGKNIHVQDWEKYQPRVLNNSEDCGNSKVQNCSCAHIACCCHTILSETTRRRCYSESVCSTERSPVPETLHVTIAKRTRLRSRSCSPRGVKTLNHTNVRNLYESNQPSFVNVINHQAKPAEAIEEDLKQHTRTGSLDSEGKLRKEDLKKNTEVRCAKALNREQLKKDFQQLLSDLGRLSRNGLLLKHKKIIKPVYQREREIITKNEIKQEKLAEAFEYLFDSEKPTVEINISYSSSIQHAGEDRAPPTLNLAAYSNCHTKNTTNLQLSNSTNQNNKIKDQQPCHKIDQHLCEKTNNYTSIETDQESYNLIDQQMFSRSPSPLYTGSGLPSPCSPRPESKPTYYVSPKKQSGEVLVQVKLEGRKRHKKKCKQNISHRAEPGESSTSYYSPPENLTPSQQRLLDALITQVNKKAISEDLKVYIKTLLSMSRESINELNVSTSSSNACSESVKSPEERKFQEDMVYLSALTEKYADKVTELVDMFERMDSPEFPEHYKEPPCTLQSETKMARPLSHCPPASTPSPLSHLGPHISSQCRYCQPTGESERKVMRPKTPPPRSRQHRMPVKCGQQFEVVPCDKYSSEPVDSNYHKIHPFSPNESLCPPDHPSGNTTQYPCSHTRSQFSPNQSSQSPNKSPAQLPCNPNPGTTGSKCTSSSSAFRARAIHTPFSLSSNLLPHPREVFGHQDATSTGLPPGENLDDSMAWLLEINGIPPPPSSDLDPNQLAAAYRREHMPNEDTIVTPNSSFDMKEYLEQAEGRIMKTITQSYQKTSDKLSQAENLESGTDSVDSAVFFSTSALVDMRQESETSGSEHNLQDCAVDTREQNSIARDRTHSPLNLQNLRERISEVCFEHRTRIADYLLHNFSL